MEGQIKDVVVYWMKGEIENFIKVWISVCISLCYSYFVAKIVPKGILRFSLFLPIVCLFLILPLNLHSTHLGGTTSFFIAWLANFKLLLLAFDKGPLSDPSISLPFFLAVACLPIKIQQKFSDSGEGSKNPSSQSGHSTTKIDHQTDLHSILNYGIKGLLLGSIIKIYDYSEQIHPYIILFLYCFHMYFLLEIIVAISAALGRLVLGVELEPTFKEPLLSTSLQDFWGRRWNIMVNRILRPSVYDPVLNLSTKYLGREWAPLPAIFGTFFVSGLMHELIFYYMGRIKPTWNVTWFFLLHGACLVAEVAAKKVINGRYRLPRVVGSTLVVGFVMFTGLSLFLPEMLRFGADVKAFEEYAAVGAFLKDVTRALMSTPVTNATRV